MKRKCVKTIGLLIGLVLAGQAFGAQWASVVSDTAEVYDGPTKRRTLIKKIKKGDQVQASNMPVEGMHKVRLHDGMIGWIKMEDLLLKGPPSE